MIIFILERWGTGFVAVDERGDVTPPQKTASELLTELEAHVVGASQCEWLTHWKTGMGARAYGETRRAFPIFDINESPIDSWGAGAD